MLKGLDIRIGAQPIIWSNDDFHELGGDIPLERCLREMGEAGYAGTELGHKFPRDPDALARALRPHGLQLVSGWHSTHLASRELEEEKRDFARHLDLLSAIGSRVAIVAECTRRNYNDPGSPLLGGKPALDDGEWTRLAEGLEALAELAAGKGLRLAYHHHMGTVVQDSSEIERLMGLTRTAGLLADTGHMAFAGVDPVRVLREYAGRIAHVHLKNVRPHIVERVREERLSFAEAVKRGVFTVPGDCDPGGVQSPAPSGSALGRRGSGIDFTPIFRSLRDAGYKGWMIVEAEQDPRDAEPLRYARKAREYIREAAGL